MIKRSISQNNERQLLRGGDNIFSACLLEFRTAAKPIEDSCAGKPSPVSPLDIEMPIAHH